MLNLAMEKKREELNMFAMKIDDEIILMKESMRRFMSAHDLSITSWSKMAGLTESTLRSYLNNITQRSLKVETISKLADAVGVDATYILKFGRGAESKKRSVWDKDILLKVIKSLRNEIDKYEKLTGNKITDIQYMESFANQYDQELRRKAIKIEQEKLSKRGKEKENNHS